MLAKVFGTPMNADATPMNADARRERTWENVRETGNG
jgi:hypothetical protein